MVLTTAGPAMAANQPTLVYTSPATPGQQAVHLTKKKRQRAVQATRAVRTTWHAASAATWRPIYSAAHHVAEQGSKVHGLREGTWTSYYPNGQPMEASVSTSGKLNGHTTRWYQNGKIGCDGYFVSGKRDAQWRYYYPSGAPLAVMHYAGGSPTGHWIRWWESGRVMESGNFKNGKAEGAWTSYFADGHPRSIIRYSAGQFAGHEVSYYPNGSKPFYPTSWDYKKYGDNNPMVLDVIGQFGNGMLPVTYNAPFNPAKK